MAQVQAALGVSESQQEETRKTYTRTRDDSQETFQIIDTIQVPFQELAAPVAGEEPLCTHSLGHSA